MRPAHFGHDGLSGPLGNGMGRRSAFPLGVGIEEVIYAALPCSAPERMGGAEMARPGRNDSPESAAGSNRRNVSRYGVIRRERNNSSMRAPVNSARNFAALIRMSILTVR